MAWANNEINVQWSSSSTVDVTTTNESESDAISLTAGPWNRSVTVQATAASAASGNVATVYWVEYTDPDNDSTDEATNQGTYLGTLDTATTTPAVKTFGLHTNINDGTLIVSAEDSTVTVTFEAIVTETVYS